MSNTEELKCPSCKTNLHSGAKFCHECGAKTGEKSDKGRWNWKYIVPLLGVFAVIAVALVVGLNSSSPQQQASAPLPSLRFSAPAQPSAQSVDLSEMLPREAANRLFNRVMRAYEGGDTVQVQQFAPMAIQAYGLIDQLDTDAHYDLGLLSFVSGDIDSVRKRISELKQASANHLLGFDLAYRVAKSAGDDQSVFEILKEFAAAYDTEIASNRPEYTAHRNTIDKLHALTTDSQVR